MLAFKELVIRFLKENPYKSILYFLIICFIYPIESIGIPSLLSKLINSIVRSGSLTGRVGSNMGTCFSGEGCLSSARVWQKMRQQLWKQGQFSLPVCLSRGQNQYWLKLPRHGLRRRRQP